MHVTDEKVNAFSQEEIELGMSETYCEKIYDSQNRIIAVIVNTPNGKVQLRGAACYYFTCAMTQLYMDTPSIPTSETMADELENTWKKEEADLALKLQSENLENDPELKQELKEHAYARREIEIIENAMNMNINDGKHYLEGLQERMKKLRPYTNRYEHLEDIQVFKLDS